MRNADERTLRGGTRLAGVLYLVANAIHVVSLVAGSEGPE